jgi:anthranilate phosphoribosyltransferase
VCELKNGWFRSYELAPEQFGLKRCKKDDLIGGAPQENAEITRAILRGETLGSLAAKRDAVLLNSAAAISIARPELDIAAGIDLARETIDSGKALAQLENFINLSQGNIK